ncbi:MAG TPA: ABC transporter ATP-binding protein [Bdellovibrionota bacterium]|nr:ABC transporter ATP-binding protein [Bdellovibrionota bacterium]
MNETIVEFEKVTKDFTGDFWKKKVRGLDDVTFSVHDGDVFGLIGPNGAGKTTAIKILMGLLKPTRGSVRVLGLPVTDIQTKRYLGYLPENAYYYDYLRTEELLDFYGRLFGLRRSKRHDRIDELLEAVGLSDKKGVHLRHYSKGMLQRIGIAQALMNDPKLVILDEPMSGLDPIGRKDMRDVILRLAQKGKTVLFSSHILTDVEAICERVGILIRGKLTACGSISELVRSRIKSIEVIFRRGTKDPTDSVPSKWVGQVTMRKSGDQMVMSALRPDILNELIDWGRGRQWMLLSVVPQKETLEDIFMKEAGE